jgi:hypothetical protein
MLNMAKRLGDDEDGAPAIVAGIVKSKSPRKFDPSKRLGEEDPSDDEATGEDPESLIEEACRGLCKSFQVSEMAAPRVAQYLKTIFNACDSLPHEEYDGEKEEG